MFLLCKRKNLVIALFVVIALQITLTFVACLGQLSQKTSLVDFTVVIDAGHGGIDAGVTASDGTKESDLNLDYAKTLGKIFDESGFKVVYTRTKSEGLYGLPTKGFKLRDMQERKKIIEQSNADMVISIHMNQYAPQISRKGPQVFFQQNTVGEQLAKDIQKCLNDFTGNTHATLKGDYYMCREISCVSVIVECGFLSNADELKNLKDANYRQQLCYTIFNGAMLYLCAT